VSAARRQSADERAPCVSHATTSGTREVSAGDSHCHQAMRQCPTRAPSEEPTTGSPRPRAPRPATSRLPSWMTSKSDPSSVAGGSFAIWMQKSCCDRVVSRTRAQTCFRGAPRFIAAARATHLSCAESDACRGRSLPRPPDRHAARSEWRRGDGVARLDADDRIPLRTRRGRLVPRPPIGELRFLVSPGALPCLRVCTGYARRRTLRWLLVSESGHLARAG
jgi:hypothetical protein